ncbi:MAG: PIN domain-containing protein [Planctomycetaceae bacterium]
MKNWIASRRATKTSTSSESVPETPRRTDRDVLSSDGTSLAWDLAPVRVVIKASHQQRLKEAFLEDCPDHRILDVALTLQQDESPRPVVLVTKDTNLRMKAKSLGLTAQDYSTDKVESMDKLYTGKRAGRRSGQWRAG